MKAFDVDMQIRLMVWSWWTGALAFYMGRIITFHAVSEFGCLAFLYIFMDFEPVWRINGEYSLHLRKTLSTWIGTSQRHVLCYFVGFVLTNSHTFLLAICAHNVTATVSQCSLNNVPRGHPDITSSTYLVETVSTRDILLPCMILDCPACAPNHRHSKSPGCMMILHAPLAWIFRAPWSMLDAGHHLLSQMMSTLRELTTWRPFWSCQKTAHHR